MVKDPQRLYGDGQGQNLAALFRDVLAFQNLPPDQRQPRVDPWCGAVGRWAVTRDVSQVTITDLNCSKSYVGVRVNGEWVIS